MVIDKNVLTGPILIRCPDHLKRYRSAGILRHMHFGPIRKNFIWRVDNWVVGAVSITKTSDFECWLTNVYVDEMWRNNGIAKMMVEFAVREHRCNVLTVDPNNKPAIAVYRKFGFRNMGKDKSGSDIMAIDGWVASGISKDRYDTNSPTLIW